MYQHNVHAQCKKVGSDKLEAMLFVFSGKLFVLAEMLFGNVQIRDNFYSAIGALFDLKILNTLLRRQLIFIFKTLIAQSNE